MILVILISVFAHSDKTKENAVKETQEITVDYRLFSDSSDKWWNIYSDTVLNEIIETTFEANKNPKTVQKNLSVIQNSFGKNEMSIDISTVKVARINKISDDIELSAGEGLNPAQLEYKLIYSNDLLGKINNLSSNKNYKLDSLELESKWMTSNLAMTATKLYGYYIYLNIEEKNLAERMDIVKELEKLEELKISLKRGNGDGLLDVQEIKKKVESLITQNESAKKLTEKNLSMLFGNDKVKTARLLEQARNNSNVGIYDKISVPEKLQSDAIRQRPDTSYYLSSLKEQGQKIAVYIAYGYPNFWITGETGMGNDYEQLEKKDKIGNSYYFQRYSLDSEISNKKPVQVPKDQKDFIEQYNNTIMGAYKNVNESLADEKKSADLLEKDNLVFAGQNKIADEAGEKLNAGVISKYEYFKVRYNYLTQDLHNLQLRHDLFIQKINLVYNLGGTDEFNGKK